MKIIITKSAALLGGLIFCTQFLHSIDVAIAQSEYTIAISDISYIKIHKNWLFIPTAVDLRIEWTMRVLDTEKVTYEDPKQLAFIYQVFAFEETSDTEPEKREIRNADFAVFHNKKVGSEFNFMVRAYTTNSKLIAESEVASIMVGIGDNGNNDVINKSWVYYVHPGRWQLSILGKAEVYDRATPLGKLAFIFLSVTAFMGFLMLIIYSSRTLYLGNVFPYKRSPQNWIWSCSLSCDVSYENRLVNKFKFVLKAWDMIASKSRRASDKTIKNIPGNLSSAEMLAYVDVACMKYWTTDGDKAIGTIENILAFPENSKENGPRKPDDLLEELLIKIEDNFQDLISIRGDSNSDSSEIEDIGKLKDEIYEPVIMDEKPIPKLRRWILRKGLFDLKKGLEPFPTSRIIHAGLAIHRMYGYQWLKPSSEVKRAFEDRASNEIEILRRKSKTQWFWNYGSLAPLVGLFGTVTGITYAFQQLSKSNVTPDVMITIQQLSNGIFEALWTTIFGLANGIFFLIVYYYFNNKLDWIYSKWEEIYVSITEKL